ncbi:MAG: 1-deoxy-D-xylulose-5-phosphate reductoisomerase [Candidatus Amulumruptor caecigallinarius]|nr:1-deoxy-D-xylulose-5-phosphate reductoisomerase [Candidatus Amulumruptor caecigallinarius]MCM1397787.1 1-deoxy-D-xylulose-5-phosphate reductoisomerase [Candidatus Amulumruptor caecigallinarius]MCM1454826.1 1-deoxy-D-xylulose-5-phosphate reductoisomerase [bacterium]
MSHTAPKSIAILGSTGSIGTQTLDIVRAEPERFRVAMLSAGRNVELLIEQARELRPSMAVIGDDALLPRLREALAPMGIETAAGEDALADAMERNDFTLVVTATVGYSGLLPTVRAIRAGKDIALANKETLVAAGAIVSELVRERGVKLFPIDSEHSAIRQCLSGEDPASVSRLIITASGGPFRTFTPEQLATVTVADALRHPNWSMGAKITIDSATMLNKAFEIIEARWLFDIPGERIHAVVHPQSIIHSMVEFVDGGIKAQLGIPDMHLPISYALHQDERVRLEGRLTMQALAGMTFEEPDTARFPCLTFAHRALEAGGNFACTVNAAGEVAVFNFLRGRIPFTGIHELIERTLAKTHFIASPSLDDIVQTNAEARAIAESMVPRA